MSKGKRKLSDEAEEAANWAWRELWGLRYEGGAVAIAWLPLMFVPWWAGVLWLIVWVGIVVWQWERLGKLLQIRSLVRRWTRAMFAVGLNDGKQGGWGPKVAKVLEAPAGEVLEVRIPAGMSGTVLEQKRGAIETSLRCEVEVKKGSDPSRWLVALKRRDPFDLMGVLEWPNRGAGMLSSWDPLPIGVDENGEAVKIRMVERNLLLGGEPGSGKSGVINNICATAALDPDAEVDLIDGKQGVELAPWAACAKQLAVSIEDANALLERVQLAMEGRYRELRRQGWRKVERSKGSNLIWVIIDELALFCQHADKKERDRFNALLTDIVARGRAAGVIVIAATQKPGGDVIPTKLRDLFGFRLALACNTPDASDTILGRGWASAGADATKIAKGQKGVGFLLAEEGLPERIRGYWLSDDDVEEIASRAAAARTDTEWADAQDFLDGARG